MAVEDLAKAVKAEEAEVVVGTVADVVARVPLRNKCNSLKCSEHQIDEQWMRLTLQTTS